MKYVYDGQIRRYLTQMVRMLSGYKYQAADGTLKTVPVAYGDMTRQVASIIRDNSENKIPSAPRIALYITGLELDRTRTSDATHVSKVHIRERALNEDGAEYLNTQGANYTVERLMPTPYKLSVKVDIWTTSTDQKLQILEQILMPFNPSIEIQTTDNYLDWTSLSVVNLHDIVFSYRTIPVGVESDIDVATLGFDTPIWISAPAKVKKLGIVTDIIMNIFDESGGITEESIFGKPIAVEKVNIGSFGVLLWNNELSILDPKAAIIELNKDATVPLKINAPTLNWAIILDQYPGMFKAGLSQIFLTQKTGNELVGTVSLNPLDDTKLTVSWDQDTFPTNTLINSTIFTTGRGNIDAIIDPTRFTPGAKADGTRYLILEDIGNIINQNGATAWKSTTGADFVAKANDIIEWNGSAWEVVLEAAAVAQIVYVTNLKTGIQYKLESGEWTKSFDGEYLKGEWRLVL